ncbi:MAG: redoxin domain-containing protein [Planctomycetales bacterium]|nr:redoxin domain-containing protein [Planctomycetales bacterium]
MLSAVALGAACSATSVQAASPTVEDALKLKPVQTDVSYDIPEAPADCRLENYAAGKVSGWHVYSSSQQLLRRFLDTNDDQRVDHWCYYKNGVEVYRDVDSDFDGKADQFRWLGTGGIRWGVDADEDGAIDAWKVISPEEVTSETVTAIQEGDAARFGRLLISEEELQQLGVSDSQLDDIRKRIKAAKSEFTGLARAQQKIGKDARWIHFGGSQPGVIPAATKDNTKDIYVYDNVSAVIAQGDGKHAQVAVGTLVQVGQAWRLIDLPSALDESQVARGGYFFQEMLTSNLAQAQAQAGAISPQMQKLITELADLDKEIEAARTITTKAKLNEQRAQLLMDIVKAAPNNEVRDVWVQAYADTIGAAIQQGAFPNGIKYLRQLVETVLKPGDEQLVAHVEFVAISSEYERQMGSPDIDEEKIGKLHEQWLGDLEKFIDKHPKSEDAPEALLQLGFNQEFAGKQEDAVKYYDRIVSGFPAARVHAKAAGAKRRLESVGKPLTLTGTDSTGKSFQLSSLRGKVVLIHYWASWCEVCTQDMETIRKAQAKFGNDFVPVGINCDNQATEMAAFLKKNRLPWPQLHEPMGMENRLVNELGVLSLPMMLLVDKNGRVVNNNIDASQLEAELEKQLR